MDTITEIFKLDFIEMFISIFTIIIGVNFAVSALEKFCGKFGIESKKQREKREEHELLVATANGLTELKNQHEEDMTKSDENDDMIRKDLEKLTSMFVDKEIEDMRWEIINIADKLTDGKSIGKETYRHSLRTYDKYEQIIEENNLTNSEVDLSIDIIRKSYAEKQFND